MRMRKKKTKRKIHHPCSAMQYLCLANYSLKRPSSGRPPNKLLHPSSLLVLAPTPAPASSSPPIHLGLVKEKSAVSKVFLTRSAKSEKKLASSSAASPGGPTLRLSRCGLEDVATVAPARPCVVDAVPTEELGSSTYCSLGGERSPLRCDSPRTLPFAPCTSRSMSARPSRQLPVPDALPSPSSSSSSRSPKPQILFTLAYSPNRLARTGTSMKAGK